MLPLDRSVICQNFQGFTRTQTLFAYIIKNYGVTVVLDEIRDLVKPSTL